MRYPIGICHNIYPRGNNKFILLIFAFPCAQNYAGKIGTSTLTRMCSVNYLDLYACSHGNDPMHMYSINPGGIIYGTTVCFNICNHTQYLPFS